MQLKLQYRPDIDGLRAIAVLSVLFYHAGINAFSGGFVGVDVFFVISGYLITSIIVREIRVNKFTLFGFYERRIRRIYPALFVTVAFTLLAGALLFDAENYAALGNSTISVTFFLSNVLFWTEAGYFDKAAALKPLLHAWSLSVEEQFYILFPLLMALIARHFKSRFGRWLTGITLASLALNIYWVNRDASAAFYLTQFRAWELLAGSLLALDVIPTRIGAGLRNALSLAGITLVLASVVLFDHETPFPGVAALLPVLGSALLIYTGMDGTSLIEKALSLPPFVFIGKISYSLYLWHWPLLVFMKYYLIREPTAAELAACLLAAFMISALSWKYVENPFRVRSFLAKPRIFVFAGSVMILSLIASAAIYVNDGFPARFTTGQVISLGRNDPEWTQWESCTASRKNYYNQAATCSIGAEGQSPSFLLWGDSHARALAPAIDVSAAKAGAGGYITGMMGCPPLFGLDYVDEYQGHCYNYNRRVALFIQKNPQLKTVILAARWALPIHGSYYKTEAEKDLTLIDMMQNQKGSNAALFDIGLHRTIDILLQLNRRVIIVTGIPEVGYDVPSAFSIAIRTGRDPNEIIAPTFQEYLERNQFALDVFKALEEDKAIQIIDLSKALCNEYRCNAVANGQPLYLDEDHLSPFGSYYISYLFESLFKELASE